MAQTRRLTTGYDERQWRWLTDEARRCDWSIGKVIRNLVNEALAKGPPF